MSARGGAATVYGLGVALYAGLFALVFAVGGVPLGTALAAALGNALPPALLGIAVVRDYRAGRRPATGLVGVLRHAVAALLFATAATAGTWVFFRLDAAIRTGRDVGPVDPTIVFWQVLLSLLVFAVLATAGHAAGTRESLRRERLRAAEAEALRTRAELAALRARLDPHFLFNTLHTVLSLVRSDPAAAEEALEELGTLLRHTLEADDESEARTIGEEWKLTEGYLAIERLRLGDRLRVEATIDAAAAGLRLPVLTLQPLVENAVRHAVAPRAAGGSVRVSATLRDGVGEVVIVDDGLGATAEALAGGGRGLRLVRERLACFFAGRAELAIDSPAEGGTTVTLRFPVAVE